MQSVLELKNLKKYYHLGDYTIKALQGINLRIGKGDFVAVMGASGSGKSTLMNILGCLDKPTEGDYFFEDKNINLLNDDEYAEIRNGKIGFVFQGFNLLPRTTAIENVELPLFYDRKKERKNYKEIAAGALTKVGLGDRLHHNPSRLSGGQQQRVAIARALVNDPSIILADEPTGNLDTVTSLEIMSIFQELNNQKITIVLVTHEPDIAAYAKRIINMRDGHIIGDKKTKQRSAKDDSKRFRKNNTEIFNED